MEQPKPKVLRVVIDEKERFHPSDSDRLKSYIHYKFEN